MVSSIRRVVLLVVLTCSALARAQITLPPNGDNQRSQVTQQIGPVSVTIEYSSPRVVRGKEDRRGQIWGKLVPYGLADIGSNVCAKCPWRAGANENTVFATSRDVKVQGQTLPAGRYGVHMIPGTDDWTIIFSKTNTAWGSYSYDPKEDALRVHAKPAKSEYHEWLTYEFTEREPARAVMALKWEERQVPIAISVDNAPALWVEGLRRELRGEKGFVAENLRQAADYCIASKVSLPEALNWAQLAVSGPFMGEESFRTLMTLSRAQAAAGREAEAAKTADRAIAHATAKPIDVHVVGRQLLADGKKQEALRVFEANAKRFPDQWPVHVGLMRGYAAVGRNKEALAEARLAVKQAPDEPNRNALQKAIKSLEAGKGID
jgi:hypothetical protein